VWPAAVQVSQGQNFELNATAFDAAGHVISQDSGHEVTWNVNPPSDLTLLLSSEGTAQFSVPNAGPKTVKLNLVLDAASTDLLVNILPTSVNPYDIFKAHHTGGAIPELALVRSARSSVAVENELDGFVSLAEVPDLERAGTLAVFSWDKRAAYVTENWRRDIQETTDVTGAAAQSSVPLEIWDGTRDGLGDLHDVEVAKLIFQINRTGVTFTSGTPIRIPETSLLSNDCQELPARFGFDPHLAILRVFYVESLDAGNGYTCEPSSDATQLARSILIGASRNPTTLAHELGHVAGLVDPTGGHTDCVPGFREDNLMWVILTDDGYGNRLNLSLGQTFRIALDKRSWVTTLGDNPAANPPVCSDATQPCPALPAPVIPTSAWPVGPWCP
jgi:hypothetical protein